MVILRSKRITEAYNGCFLAINQEDSTDGLYAYRSSTTKSNIEREVATLMQTHFRECFLKMNEEEPWI